MKVKEEFVFTYPAIRNLPPGLYRDTKLRCLYLRVGAKPKTRGPAWSRRMPKHTWYFQFEARRNGKRIFVCKKIDALFLEDARKAAEIKLGEHRLGNIKPGPRQAITLNEAMGYNENDDGSVANPPEGSYLRHLNAKAAGAGKEPTWAKNVRKMYVRHIGLKFGNATLADLSNNTGILRDWHKQLTKTAGPVAANHCARILRACYRFKASESEHKLAMADLPTRAIKMNPETSREVDMRPLDFCQWATDVAKIKNASRRALHVAMLLSGARPGEISRAKWSDLKLHERQLVIRKGKASAIVLVLSWPLVRSLRVARDWAKESGINRDYIFPAREGALRGTRKPRRDKAAQWRGHAKQFAQDGLEFYGNALRHAYATIAAGHATAADLDLLTSHGPANQTAEYIGRKMRARQREVRDAQGKISRRILALMNDPALRCLRAIAAQQVQSRTNSPNALEDASIGAMLAI